MKIIIVGDNASGKSTLEKSLIQHGGFEKVVSATTREARPGEIDGVDYYFCQKEGEDRGLPVFNPDEMGELVEFGGQLYGAPKKELEKSDRIVVVAEPNGAKQILSMYDDAYVIYMDIPKKVRMQNLIKEGIDPEEAERRMSRGNIAQDVKDLDLRVDLRVKKLSKHTAEHVLEWIDVVERLYG